MIWLKRSIYFIINSIPVGKQFLGIYELYKYYLTPSGWVTSAVKKEAISADGQLIPWFTYPSIKFLDERIGSEFSVLEYGSGNSTYWFSQRVEHIVSIESDHEWWPVINKKLAAIRNIELKFIEHESVAYVNATLYSEKRYDIVIIDGRKRVETALKAPLSLKENGIIIFDNTERSRYQAAFDFLVSQGFKRLDFWGLAPGVSFETCTSIFYRTANCLNL